MLEVLPEQQKLEVEVERKESVEAALARGNAALPAN